MAGLVIFVSGTHDSGAEIVHLSDEDAGMVSCRCEVMELARQFGLRLVTLPVTSTTSFNTAATLNSSLTPFFFINFTPFHH